MISHDGRTVTEPPLSSDYRVLWRTLAASERRLLYKEAGRGIRGRSKQDAALMPWFAREELRKGWRTAVAGIAGTVLGVALALVGISLLEGDDLGRVWDEVRESGVLGYWPLLLLPLVLWARRRPALKRTVQLNAAVLAGQELTGPPDPEEAERLLAVIRKEGWLRGMRPQR